MPTIPSMSLKQRSRLSLAHQLAHHPSASPPPLAKVLSWPPADDDIQAFHCSDQQLQLASREAGQQHRFTRDTTGWIIICAASASSHLQEEIQDLHIQGDEYLIAEGAYGLVTGACIKNYGQCAIKWLRDERRQQLGPQFEQEADLMESLVHPSIVTVKAAVYAPACASSMQQGPAWVIQGIVMEFIHGGTLAQWIGGLSRRGQRLNLRTRCLLLLSIAQGLDYLHSRPHPIIHCDIKPENILIDWTTGPEPQAKITDFGLALITLRTGQIELHAHRGTPEFMAPEMVPEYGAASTLVTPAADMWSVGMLMCVLITQQLPYNWTTDNEILEALRSRDPLYLPIPLDCEQPWFILIKRCLHVNPQKRLTAKQLATELETLLTDL